MSLALQEYEKTNEKTEYVKNQILHCSLSFTKPRRPIT